MNETFYTRQASLINPSRLTLPIGIIGAGGIGSWTALALGKLGCSHLEVWDFDNVEAGNVGSQLYTSLDIGQEKTQALARRLSLLLEEPIRTKTGKIEDNISALADYQIIISAVDSMETRAKIYRALKNQAKTLIDGRMGGNAIELYTIPLADNRACEMYEKNLFADGKALPIPCGSRAVVYNTLIISGMIADIVSHIVNGVSVPSLLDIDLANFSLFNEG